VPKHAKNTAKVPKNCTACQKFVQYTKLFLGAQYIVIQFKFKFEFEKTFPYWILLKSQIVRKKIFDCQILLNKLNLATKYNDIKGHIFLIMHLAFFINIYFGNTVCQPQAQVVELLN